MKDVVKTKDHKWQSLIMFIVIVALFVITRSAYLDRDLPPSGIGSYIAIDEMYYTIPAFNQYHYGEAVYNVVPEIEQMQTKDALPTNILENILTYYSLTVFGNNYYGLRMASVVAALISFVLLFLIIRKILNDCSTQRKPGKSTHQNLVLYFIMAYLLFDFSFLMAGRVAEPTIFRLLAMVIIIYIGSVQCFSSTHESKWQSILLGFLSMAAVAFVYIYNFFIFAAMGTTVLIWAGKSGRKNAIKQFGHFILGSLLCIVVYQLFIDIVYHTCIAEVCNYLTPFNSRIGLGISTTDRVLSYSLNSLAVFLTNIFRLNIILLFITLVSLPIFVKKVKTDRQNFDILIFNISLFLILQSIVINDYPLRKLIMLLPLTALIIASAFRDSKSFFMNGLSNTRTRRFINLYWFTSFMITLSIWTIYFIVQFKQENSVELGNYTFLNLTVFIIVSSIMVFKYIKGINVSQAGILMCMILILIPNMFLDYRYVFSDRFFYYRDAMIAMGEKVNGKITVGGCSYGFRLYNESIPVLDSYIAQEPERFDDYNRNFDMALAQGIASYSVAYTSDKPIDGAIGNRYMQDHGLELEQVYELGDAVDTDVGLYTLRKE